jgi:DNA-directed RNA polymerase subunit F
MSPLTMPTDPTELRPLLHEDINRLSDENLSLAHKLLMEIELHQLADSLDEAADEARVAGRLTPERIAEAVAAHRAARQYR